MPVGDGRLADIFGVDEATFVRWQEEHPELRRALDEQRRMKHVADREAWLAACEGDPLLGGLPAQRPGPEGPADARP
jgi:hypothetical protein